jgi:hypothetical protein
MHRNSRARRVERRAQERKRVREAAIALHQKIGESFAMNNNDAENFTADNGPDLATLKRKLHDVARDETTPESVFGVGFLALTLLGENIVKRLENAADVFADKLVEKFVAKMREIEED